MHTNEPPAFRSPQLATLVDATPAGDGWIHEMKFDGYRCLLAIGGGKVRAYTRSGLDWSEKFAPIVAAAARLKVRSALIDGEAVVLDERGVSNFQALQGALKGGHADLVYFAFDLLEVDGEDISARPLLERKRLLARVVSKTTGTVRYSQHIAGRGERLFAEFCAAGLEGVVSKRADRPYVSARSDNWLKTKCLQRQEFVIVGWTQSLARSFRSLLLAVNEKGRLRFAGKVGTGFNTAELDRLMKLMKPLRQGSSAIDAPRAIAKDAIWIKPSLVAEIAYTETTADGVLRHPSFLGLREDKRAEAVVVERPARISGKNAAASRARIQISNRDRVIYPESNTTKGELADYYDAMAEFMLPWVGERPISLVRCPQGRAKKCFFQKHDAGSFGDDVKQVAIREKDGAEEPYIFVESPKGLLTCVQMGTIEFHGWGARIEDVEKPDRLVFDLDPDEGLDFDAVRHAALDFRKLLKEIGLATYPMVTGGKGVHVIAPLTPKAEWPEVKAFARGVAQAVSAHEPERFTAALSKAKRGGKIFVDYLRNQRGATAVLPYSARARPYAPVAVPISWQELRTVQGPAQWRISDVAALVKRARAKSLLDWGRATQALPRI